jgi:hypothetical protein
MLRRAVLAFALAALPAATLPAAALAAGGEDPKKRSGGSSYLVVQTLVGTTTKGAKRGVLTVECGLDVQDEKLRERTRQSMPRLRAAYAQIVQTYAAGLPAGQPPNVDFLAQNMQRQTDAVLGRKGAKLLLGAVLVN